MSSTAPTVPLWVLEIVPAIVTVSGGLIVAVCRPLMAGKIGPNRLYGIRTPQAFKSEEDWYRINRQGGRILRQAGIFVFFVGLAGFPIAPLALPEGLIAYNVTATVLVLGAIARAGFRILRLH